MTFPAQLNRAPFGCSAGVGLEDRTEGWTEPAVWSSALEGENDFQRLKTLNLGLRTWDGWIRCLRGKGFLTQYSGLCAN